MTHGNYLEDSIMSTAFDKSKNMKILVLMTLLISVWSGCACQDECQKDEDCPDGFCIIKKIVPFMKQCEKFLLEGDSCMKEQEIFKNVIGFYYYISHCGPGLNCTSENSVSIPYLGNIEYDFHCSSTGKEDNSTST